MRIDSPIPNWRSDRREANHPTATQRNTYCLLVTALPLAANTLSALAAPGSPASSRRPTYTEVQQTLTANIFANATTGDYGLHAAPRDVASAGTAWERSILPVWVRRHPALTGPNSFRGGSPVTF